MKPEKKDLKAKRLDDSLKLLAKSSLVILASILFSKVLVYLYRIIIAREFGPETYGLYSLSVMIAGWFAAVFSIGLPSGITRFISLYTGKKEINKIRFIVNLSGRYLFLSGITASFILFFLSDFISLNLFHNPNLVIFLKWFSLTVFFSVLSSAFITIIFTFEKINWFIFFRYLLGNAVNLIAIIIFILLGFQVNSIIFSYALGTLITFLVSYFLCRYLLIDIFRKYRLTSKIKSKTSREFFSYSWPLMFVNLVAFIFSWVDSFMVGYFRNATEVGLYNSAVPIAALLVVAPSLFIQLFFILINKEYGMKENEVIKEMSKQVSKWIFILNLPFLIIMIMFPEAVINLFFGKEYIVAGQSLRFLAVGLFFYSIFTVSESLLSMAGKSKIILYNILIASLLNIVLNISLVPRYGIRGAAIATMITYIFWGIMTMIQAKHYVSIIPIRRKVFLILLISLIPTLILFLTKRFIQLNIFTLIIQSSLFLLLYLFLILISKSLDENDMMILRTLKKKFLKNAFSRLKNPGF